MADLNARIKPKKSSTSGEVPLAADLEVAELAINTADGTLFTKHTDNTVVTISGGGGGGGGTSLPSGSSDGEALIWENGAWSVGPVIGGVNYTPSGGDANFSDVSLLLLGNGTNGSTAFTDSSSNSLAVTANGAAEISTAEYKFGGSSIHLPSSSQGWLSMADDTLLNLSGDFTVEAWFYITGNLATYQTIIGSATSSWSTGAVHMYVQNGVMRVTRNGSTGMAGTASIANNTWYHVALTRSGTDVTLFIDGVVDATQTNSSAFTFNDNGTLIGKNGWDGSSTRFAGYIDDLRVTKGVARYTAAFTPPAAELPTSGTTITIPYSIDKLDDVDTSTVAPVNGDVLFWDNGSFVPGPSVNTLRQNYTPPTGFEVWNDTFLLRDPSLATLSSDGFTATYGSGVTQAHSTTTKSTGKWYWEIKLNGSTDANQTIGIGTSTNNWVGSGDSGGIGVFVSSGGVANNSGGTGVSSISSIAADDVMMFALDADAKKFWIGKNGTWENSGDPAAGTGEVASAWPDGKDWMFIGRLHGAGQGYTIETSGAVGTGIEIPASIGDLDDVDTSTYAPSDGQALAWDNTAQKWEPKTIISDGTADAQIAVWEQGQWIAGSAVSTLQSDYTAPSGFGYWSDTFLLRDPANATLSNNDLTATYGSAVTQAYSTTTKSTGKWYWEIRIDGGTDNNSFLGIAPNTDIWVGSSQSEGIGVNGGGGIANASGGTTAAGTVSSHSAGDVRMFALDADAKKLWIGKNGTWDNSGDPAAGTGEVVYGWPDGVEWMFICRIHTAGFGNTIRVTGSLGGGLELPDSIDDLSDVDTSTVAPTDGQALVWDAANSKWEPGTISGGAVDPGDAYYNDVEVLLHFDGTDGSTTLTDDSKNSWTVTASNQAQISTTQSKFGGSSFYAGSTTAFNAATIADNDALTLDADFTIEAWIYVVAVPGSSNWATILSKWNSGGEYTFLVRDDSSISFGWGSYNVNSIDSPLLRSSASSISTNTWMHVAVTRSGNDFKMYIDGTQADSATESSTPSNTSSPLTIGAYSSGEARRLDGYIDDVRITKGVARYTSAFNVPTTAFSNTQATATSINDNVDVDTSTVAPTDGQVLAWDNTAQKWEPATPTTSGLPTAQDGEALIYENGQWVAGPVIGGVDYTLPTGTTYPVPTGFAFWDDPFTIEPAAQASTVTLTNGDRTAEQTGGVSIERNAVSTSTKSTGKWYWEVLIDVQAVDSLVGITPNPANGFPGASNTGGIGFYRAGQVYNNSGATATNNSAFVTGDVIMLALDADAKKLWYGKNGTWDNSGDPVAGTGALATNWTGTPDWYFACRFKGLGGEKYTLVYGTSTVIPYSIDKLDDVDTSTVAPTDGQALVWDNTAQKWEPGTVSGGGGISRAQATAITLVFG